MGVLNPTDELMRMFDATETVPQRISVGKHVGVVSSAAILIGEDAKKKMGWAEVVLDVRLTTDTGSMAFFELELSPLADKSGGVHPGKVKFAKWQLETLGATIGNVESLVNGGSLYGSKYKFEVEEHTSSKVNPKTGKPYINRSVKLLSLVSKGLGTEDIYEEFTGSALDGSSYDDKPF